MKLKRNFVNIAGVAFAAFLHIFSIWQLDLICVGPVWAYGWVQPSPRYADQYFQCWLWKTTIGEAYDMLFFLNFASFWILFVALWFWKEDGTEQIYEEDVKGSHDSLRKLARVGVSFGFALALAGSFEQALASGDAIWSSVFGFPMLHHYLIGFIILAVSLLILAFGRSEA